jgi:hypothetical protein
MWQNPMTMVTTMHMTTRRITVMGTIMGMTTHMITVTVTVIHTNMPT